MRILLAYPVFASHAYGDVERHQLEYIDRLQRLGFDVKGFCLTLDPPGPALTFPELDLRWRWGDRKLLSLYARLEAALDGCDVLLNAAGINLHPQFVDSLPVFTAFQCFDDPEASALLSRPVATSYDLCLVGNVAEVDTYRSWGAKAEWAPMGLMPDSYDPTLTEKDILEGKRDLDIAMLSDRSSPGRTGRLDEIAKAFPTAHFHGKGWPLGYLPAGAQVPFFRRVKIGPNLHLSTGPVNFRTFYLPANGVLQICDNRSHLANVFELDREVIGFDTIDECIDRCRYFMDHDDERRAIAAAGWRRVMRDYTEEAVFRRKISDIEKHRNGIKTPRVFAADFINQHMKATRLKSAFVPFALRGQRISNRMQQIRRRILADKDFGT